MNHVGHPNPIRPKVKHTLHDPIPLATRSEHTILRRHIRRLLPKLQQQLPTRRKQRRRLLNQPIHISQGAEMRKRISNTQDQCIRRASPIPPIIEQIALNRRNPKPLAERDQLLQKSGTRIHRNHFEPTLRKRSRVIPATRAQIERHITGIRDNPRGIEQGSRVAMANRRATHHPGVALGQQCVVMSLNGTFGVGHGSASIEGFMAVAVPVIIP